MTHGTRIQEIRQEKGLSKAELAERIGRSKYFVSQIENGEQQLDADSTTRVAKALGCAARELLDRPGAFKNPPPIAEHEFAQFFDGGDDD